MLKHTLIFSIALIFSILSRLAYADTPVFTGTSAGMPFQVEQVADDLGITWGMAFLNDREMILSHRNGTVSLLDVSNGQITRLSGVAKVRTGGQGGLLDVAVPADYQAGDWIYFTYTKKVKGRTPITSRGVTTLARAKRQGDQLVEWQDLLVTQSATSTGLHFGSRITFDDNGHLFFGVGDRGERANSQDLGNHAGTILRLKLDGSVPADNPFVQRDDALPEIWSYGHRNPQGLVYDKRTERLWEIEHGPRGGDEINRVEPGKNYGWPVISYGKEYVSGKPVGVTHQDGMEQPLKTYIPSIAPSGLIVYSGKAFPAWQGNLFTGALALTHANRVVLDADGQPTEEERLLKSLGERIRAVAESPEGWIYLAADSGKILRVRPAK